MPELHTFSSIARETGRTTRAVRGWFDKAKADHGDIGTMEKGQWIFSDSERDILVSYGREVKQPKVEQVETQVVEFGEMPETVDLARFGAGSVVQLPDPDSLLNGVNAVLGAIEQSMMSDLALRTANLEEVVETKVVVEQRLRSFELNTRLYQKGVKAVAEQTAMATQSLQESLAEIQAMGKGNGQAA